MVVVNINVVKCTIEYAASTYEYNRDEVEGWFVIANLIVTYSYSSLLS